MVKDYVKKKKKEKEKKNIVGSFRSSWNDTENLVMVIRTGLPVKRHYTENENKGKKLHWQFHRGFYLKYLHYISIMTHNFYKNYLPTWLSISVSLSSCTYRRKMPKRKYYVYIFMQPRFHKQLTKKTDWKFIFQTIYTIFWESQK